MNNGRVCKNSNCRHHGIYVGDCVLEEIDIDESGMCVSFEDRRD